MSVSVRPQRRQPTGLPRPWDSPGKNTGVGCHFLLQCMKVESESEVTQSYLTLRDPMDCSLPGSSVHGICQARVLEWGAIAFSLHTCYSSLFRRAIQLVMSSDTQRNLYMHLHKCVCVYIHTVSSKNCILFSTLLCILSIGGLQRMHLKCNLDHLPGSKYNRN